MSLTEFQQEFKNTLLKITDDKYFIYAHYLAADNDKNRQTIIDNINNGIFKNKNDVANFTKQFFPVWQLLCKEGLTR